MLKVYKLFSKKPVKDFNRLWIQYSNKAMIFDHIEGILFDSNRPKQL